MAYLSSSGNKENNNSMLGKPRKGRIKNRKKKVMKHVQAIENAVTWIIVIFSFSFAEYNYA